MSFFGCTLLIYLLFLLCWLLSHNTHSTLPLNNDTFVDGRLQQYPQRNPLCKKKITYRTATLAMSKFNVTTNYFSISVCSKLQFSSGMKKCKCYFLAAIASASVLYSFIVYRPKRVPFYGSRVL